MMGIIVHSHLNRSSMGYFGCYPNPHLEQNIICGDKRRIKAFCPNQVLQSCMYKVQLPSLDSSYSTFVLAASTSLYQRDSHY